MSGPDDKIAVALIEDADVAAVVSLWERCRLTRPWNNPQADIALARRGPNSTILVGRRAGAIAASAMVGHDGHRGWIYYVAVDPAAQRRGLGRAIVAAAEDWLRLRGIAKVELLIRPENATVQRFYEAIGYAVEPRIVMSRRLDGGPPEA